MATTEEDFDSEGSDIELEDNVSEEFEREEVVEDEYMPDDPLDRAQEWDLWDTDVEEEDEFYGFQVDWRTEGYQPCKTKQFTRKAGVKQPIPMDATPLDVFSSIFTDELWDMLVTETNRYAEQTRGQTPTNSKWKPVSKTEMKTFVGLCLAFGILKLPARRDFWRQTKWLYQTNVPKAMARDRFDMIWRYLHLQDNMDPAVDKTDKLWKIRKWMDLLLVRFQALYEVNGFVTVDESMVKYKGRLGFRQYLPMKPVKWGIKVWVMAESKTGYVTHFQVYTGAIQGKMEKDLAHRIVSDLGGASVWNGACQQKGPPKMTQLTKKAELNKHEFNVAQRDELTFCVWQDTKAVMVLSNYHDPTAHGIVRRKANDGGLLPDPSSVYEVVEEVSVACYNAFVAAWSAGGAKWKYRRGGYKDWLEDLTQELIVPVTARSAPNVNPTSPTGASAEHDLVQINKKRKTCRECSLKHCGTDVRPGSTLMGCRQCNLPLHRECFMYHVVRHK
ncbi:piggyBac transposable element-derived protein 4-like [Pimephales promelas]|nr:piggyBac transposable element-derived protein 4-like [Pimephales promelas]